MDRTQFLKAFGLTLGGSALLKQSALAQVLSNGLPSAPAAARFRPGPHGQILVAHADGEAWSLHTDFGPDFEVLRVRQEAEGTFAELRHQGMDAFSLRLDPNVQAWKVQ